MAAAEDLLEHQGWAMGRHEPDGPAVADLLLLHGMGTGAWIWPAEFIDRLTGSGLRVWAMTLPGRAGGATLAADPDALPRAVTKALTAVADGAPTGTGLRILMEALPGAAVHDGPSLDDYTRALDEAVASIGGPVRIVGYSLGGAVVQNLMRHAGGQAPGPIALICSAPPYGLWRASAELAITDPALWLELLRYTMLGMSATNLDMMRNGLFPGGIEPARFAGFAARLRDESRAAMAQTAGFPPFAPHPGPRPDVLVTGGALDRLVPPADIWATALWYGSVPRFLARSGHVPMMDAGASTLCDLLADWAGA